MEPSSVWPISSMIGIIYILAVIILMIIWLLINRNALKEKSEKLKQPIVVSKTKFSFESLSDTGRDTEDVVKPKSPLKTKQSPQEPEKLLAQTLVDWKKEETIDRTSDEDLIQKVDSKELPKSATIVALVPIAVTDDKPKAEESGTVTITPTIAKKSKFPICDEEFTLDSV